MDDEEKSKNQTSKSENIQKAAEEEILKRELEKELESGSGPSGFSVSEKKFQPQRARGFFPSEPPFPPKTFSQKPSPASPASKLEPQKLEELKPSFTPSKPQPEEKKPFLDYMSKESPSATGLAKGELSKPEDLPRGKFSESEPLAQKTEGPKITPETTIEKPGEKLKEEELEEKKPETIKEEFIPKTEPSVFQKREAVSSLGPIKKEEPEEKKETSDLPPPPPKFSKFFASELPKEREFSGEREFPREREFVPSKKEKEYISREGEMGGPKEIIRTFQKDLFRRQMEVRKEEKSPEKEIPGFTPPKPPEESESSKIPRIGIPRIPIPKISLKFALIIVAVVLVLGGFYLIYQLRPCIPPFCKGGGETPPPLPLCDKEAIKNICPNQNEPLPNCDTQKLCQELNIVSCAKEEICKSLVPAPTCEPVELITPISLLPFISEERIIISQKSKSEILSGLNSINSNYQKPYLIRILIEYGPDECHRAWLSFSELFEVFGITAPQNFLSNLKDNYTLVYYFPDEEEKNACLGAGIESPLCYSSRLAIVFSTIDSAIVKSIMGGWEPTFFANFKPFILGESKEETLEFKDYLYKDKVPLRYKNLPISPTALNYGIYKNLLIIGTSKNSLTKTIDLILNKEAQDEAESRMLEGGAP